MADERPDGVPREWTWDAAFDGGDLGCGELLLELRGFVAPLEPGQHVLVAARDSGAPIEMPAWCRLTRHRLLAEQHPFYLVERRADRR
jgi:tRNA 2-thiouridine synthesizing protein A